MFVLKRSRPCHEAEFIISHVESIMAGEKTEEPIVEYPIHKNMLGIINSLFASEKQMADSAKEILEVTASISDFDMNMAYISNRLVDFANEMSNLSESNLAIVEQTNASMNQVNETVVQSASTLNDLSSYSENLITSNNEGLKQLLEVANLREIVMKDAEQMKKQIEELVDMTNKIYQIVEGVGQIADQTNLLALNASIEAARAGEHGRGFAVVAEEIRKLADDTKTNLDGMNQFVGNIQTTANRGMDSMDSTLNSTKEMSSQIDSVIVTINENVQMLNDSIEEIKNINSAMSGIEMATNEINAAMDSSSKDAEQLSHMTIQINEYALKSKSYSETIAEIDNRLSVTTKDMMNSLSCGKNTLTDADVLKIAENALGSHKRWIEKLENMVENMEVQPIQTDGNRCAFGHYYNSVNICNPKIQEIWDSIDEIHHNFHGLGDKTIDAIESGNKDLAIRHMNEAGEKSREMSLILENIVSILKREIEN